MKYKSMCRFSILFVVAILTTLFYAPLASAAGILGSAESFAVLAAASITNTDSTTITGDVGVYPGTSITGAGSITLTGAYYYPPTNNPSVALTAMNDLNKAYIGLAAMPYTKDYSGTDLGTLTLTPGVYKFDSSAQLTGTLTLNALGNPNAYWVFQIGSTLTTASSSSVVFENLGSALGSADGVFWQVGSSATLGTSTAFEGNILADTSITLGTSATILNGRALAGAVVSSGAVTMDGNTIKNVCPIGGPGSGGPGLSGGLVYTSSGAISPVPVPATMLLLGPGLVGLAAVRRRLKK
jgi:type VI secretion system secreted protein VgrG